jgi:uncharacterized membrane protein YuzA (DUF378 family)
MMASEGIQGTQGGNMSGFLKACLALTIIGALNWLLVGLFHWNLVGAIFGGDMSTISRIIYVIVGLCGLASLGIYGSRRAVTGATYDRDVTITDRDTRDKDIRRIA